MFSAVWIVGAAKPFRSGEKAKTERNGEMKR